MSKWKNPCWITIDKKSVSLPEYACWNRLRNRCDPEGTTQKVRPDKRGISHCAEWESYDNFYDWAVKQIGFLKLDEHGRIWQLDKDLLFKGNKHYSPETCVFIPQEINSALSYCLKPNRKLPIGVSIHSQNKGFVAQCRTSAGRWYRCFETADEAFRAYKEVKEKFLKDLAIKYAGLVDPRVVDALNKYTVEITD